MINIPAEGQRFVSSSFSPKVIEFRDLAEMIAVNRKRDSQCKQLRPAKKGPENHLPILEPFFAKNTQADA